MIRIFIIIFATLISGTILAAPGNGAKIQWNYQPFSTFNYGLTIGAGTIALASLAVPVSNIKTGGWLFDDEARNRLRLRDERSRLIARDISDTILTFMTAYPIMIDALVVTAWYRDSPETATQMALINAEVIAITLALTQISKVSVSRERPLGRTCGSELPEQTRLCEANNRYHSFFSGHSSQTFAMAALTCTHHIFLPIYGGGFADKAICGIGFSLATSTALLRIAGDKHYASDVIVGASVGTAVGFLVPWLMHYRRGKLASLGNTRIVPSFNGFRLMRQF